MAGQIFISYRRDGGDAMAYLLWERLLSHGYKVFFDVDSLGAGKFDARILKDIEKSSHVLLVLSPNALDRSQDKDDWVRKEIVHAVKCDKTIIPIILRGFKWPERFPKGMEGLDRYNGIEMTDLRHFTEDLDRLEELFIGKVGSVPPQCGEEDAGKRRRIFFWSDLEEDDCLDLRSSLNLEQEYQVDILKDPLDILRKEVDGNLPETIVLANTDVTKLANNPKAIENINRYLCEFVRNGGRLVCLHDMIYRRTKNVELQRLYGATIINFERREEVEYVKTDECVRTGRFANLPERFVLHDGEASAIDSIPPGAKVLFKDGSTGKPLVFARKRGRGTCVWLNTGETTESAPATITNPDPEFLELIRECLTLSL